jgi:hypothetical protein
MAHNYGHYRYNDESGLMEWHEGDPTDCPRCGHNRVRVTYHTLDRFDR